MQYVSPSDFVSIKNCPARAYLLKHSSNKLSKSPFSYYYSFCHLFLEKIRNVITEQPSPKLLREYWFENLKSFIELQRSIDPKIESILPLESKVRNAAKIRTVIFKSIIQSYNKAPDSKKGFVKRETQISIFNIRGSIDLVYRNADYVKIVDNKFGNIRDTDGNIKESYRVQLYIYSAMYYLTYEILPTHLAICDHTFTEHPVEQKSLDECLSYFESLKILNNEISELSSINEALQHANPSEDNCKYCSVKVDCTPFWESEYVEREIYFDLKGKITLISKTIEGQCIDLRNQRNQQFRIFNISKIIGRELELGDTVAILNVMRFNEFIDKYKFNQFSELVKIDG